jgi:two-component system response regulator
MTINGTAIPRAKLRVLLVEDDDDHVFLIRRALRSLAGVSVTTEIARTGEQAIEQLLRAHFHPGALPELVLLDLKMPRLDGLAVLRRLRADPTLQSLPVVVLTSSERDDDRDQALRLGATWYLCKPLPNQ